MGKFIGILLVIYLVYYAIVILLDLKQKEKGKDDEKEVFTIVDVEDENNTIKNIDIEDVENMKIPSELENEEKILTNKSIEELKRHHEEEIAIEENNILVNEEKIQNNPHSDKEERQNRFKKMMELAETSVQLVANIDGQKVYQSIL